jgi:DNA polymerase-3 subunit delta'
MPFRTIAGHGHLLELMAAAASRGTLPPSLIFAGPEGVGKRTAAVALAQLLNCTVPVSLPGGVPDACGECASCTRIARRVHADVLIIEPGDTGSIKVDQVREAIERAGYRPFEGRRRMVIVDTADAMMPEAQNALLKTLEEPPASSLFVLVTARVDMLLVTVRSRCQQLRFGRLAPADVAAVLTTAHGFAEADAFAAASASDGSVGSALEGATEDFAAARDAARRVLQTAAASGDPRRRLDGARALLSGIRATELRDELGRRLRAVASMLRDIGALQVKADERTLANGDLKAELSALVRAFDGGRTQRAFAAVDTALAALDRNASPKIVADWIAFQL